MSDQVRAELAQWGRTEDIQFSPSGQQLAIAGFGRERVFVLKARVERGRGLVLDAGYTICSTKLRAPHGLAFVGERALVVANREGELVLFELPESTVAGQEVRLEPRQTLRGPFMHPHASPGSVAAGRVRNGECEVFVCNNYVHRVGSNLVAVKPPHRVRRPRVRFARGLQVPDGVCVSGDQRWVAVSNHDQSSVHIYRYHEPRQRDRAPEGLCQGIICPHGLSFVNHDRHLIVAAAGSPHLQVFSAPSGDWSGLRLPAASIPIMDGPTFQRGRVNPQEGGPKGLAVDPSGSIVVVTSAFQPLACFAVAAVLDAACR